MHLTHTARAKCSAASKRCWGTGGRRAVSDLCDGFRQPTAAALTQGAASSSLTISSQLCGVSLCSLPAVPCSKGVCGFARPCAFFHFESAEPVLGEDQSCSWIFIRIWSGTAWRIKVVGPTLHSTLIFNAGLMLRKCDNASMGLGSHKQELRVCTSDSKR